VVTPPIRNRQAGSYICKRDVKVRLLYATAEITKGTVRQPRLSGYYMYVYHCLHLYGVLGQRGGFGY